jgi:hypothetical protein
MVAVIFGSYHYVPLAAQKGRTERATSSPHPPKTQEINQKFALPSWSGLLPGPRHGGTVSLLTWVTCLFQCVQGQAASPHATMQCRLLRNIGVAFLYQGMYADARDNFEAVQRIKPDAACAFNYLVCSYMVTSSIEQADALKQAFRELLLVPHSGNRTGSASAELVDPNLVCTSFRCP